MYDVQSPIFVYLLKLEEGTFLKTRDMLYVRRRIQSSGS
jgi:hypothetical protein